MEPFKQRYINMRLTLRKVDEQLQNGIFDEQDLDQGIALLDQLIAMLPFTFPDQSPDVEDRMLLIDLPGEDTHTLYETTALTTLQDQKFLAYNSAVTGNRPKYLPLVLQQAHTCMARFPHTGEWLEWEKSMYVLYANQVGWFTFEEETAADKLELALAAVEKGYEQSDWAQRVYIKDTKVRLLLKLNRPGEAFPIVREALSKDPDFADFQDLKTDPRYLGWLNERARQSALKALNKKIR
jgi:hypothetical protein